MKEKAVGYYKQGYSCSESILKALIDEGLADENLFACATSFSGGMSSGCLCGAVAASQMGIGFNYGKSNAMKNPEKAKELAKAFVDKFKENHRGTCCKVLSAGFEFSSPERKDNCTKIVGDCADILKEII